MKRTVATAWLAAFLLAYCHPLLAESGSGPREWLERMSTAMSQLSYQGTFVYIQGNEVETMRITHVAGDDGVRERLVSVSGAAREVLRDANGVRWVLGDDHSVMQDPAFHRSFFPRLDQYDQAERCYRLSMGASERIAGHRSRQLNILPRDRYRYGYTLWLEEHTGLLLKWQLFNNREEPMAKLMFTEIRLGSEVDERELDSNKDLQQFDTVESTLPLGDRKGNSMPKWKPERVPPGFRLMAHRYLSRPEQGMYEHLVYSDGLAAVSVYVENAVGASLDDLGLSRLGTTHAFSLKLEDHLVTVVGDVPAVTVRFIGEAVRPVVR